MTERVEVVVYVAINEKGSFISCERAEDALTLLMENHGGNFARIVTFHTMVEPARADEATEFDSYEHWTPVMRAAMAKAMGEKS